MNWYRPRLVLDVDAPSWRLALALIGLLLCGIQGSGQNSWTQLQAYPTQREGHFTARYANDIYLFGGRDGATDYDLAHKSYYWIPSPGATDWVALAPMGIGRSFATAESGSNGRIYVFGGYVGGSSTITNSVEEYNPATNTWTSKAPMPVARARMRAVRMSGLIYVIGGVNQAGTVLNLVQVYNPATNTWSTRAPMLTARADFGAVEHRLFYNSAQRRITVSGGRALANSNIGLASMETYNATTNTWSLHPYAMRVPLYHHAMEWDSLAPYFFVSGGMLPGGTSIDSVYFTPTAPSYQAWIVWFHRLARPMASHHMFAIPTASYSIDMVVLGGVSSAMVLATNYEHMWITIALPVESVALQAHQAGNRVVVNWELDAQGVVGYQLERSTDGIAFENLGPPLTDHLAGPQEAMDPLPAIGSNYYRLRIRLANGEQRITAAVQATIARPEIDCQLIPTGTANAFELTYFLPSDATQGLLRVWNAAGQQCLDTDLAQNQGKIAVNLALCPAGIYFVHVATPTQSKTIKICLR